jgi:transposase, IS5 family
VVYRDRGYFGAKSKGYDKTMKRAANEHPLGMSCILRNKGSSQKEL